MNITDKKCPYDIVDRTLVQEAITLSIELNENPHQLWRRIEAIPSVEVNEKIGYWVRWYEVKEYSWGTEHNPHCKCSECGREYDPHTSQFIKYCSNCGTRLLEKKKES